MKKLQIFAYLLAASTVAACGFQNKTEVLMPTSPSATGGSASGSSSSSASSSSSSSSSGSAEMPAPFGGAYDSGTIKGLPNIGSCTNLEWRIANLTGTEIEGSISTVCGGSVTITADLTGKLRNDDVADLTAKGQAVGFGITCGFSLTGVGTRETADSVKLDYQGSTCLGPVSGSEMLHRKTQAPPPAPAPAPAPAPQEPDDDVWMCTKMLPDKYKYVECIWDHIHPTDEFSGFEVTKRVAWGLRNEGAGLLLKPAGENIVTWRGQTFAAGRIIYSDGHLFKVLTDVGRGGANGPSWQDEGFLDTNRYVPAIDPRLP